MIAKLSSEVSLGSVKQVVLVLGKRLADNRLTEEGRLRVDALAEFMRVLDLSETAIIFCGGIAPGQHISEAQAMVARFKTHYPMLVQLIPARHLILEDRSRNTVENIENAASELIASGLCTSDQVIQFTLLSNDYHLNRILDIQTLLPEQGLLTVLKQRCQQAGLQMVIALDCSQHCLVTYPHCGEQADAFLLADELTTYRVYLEGVVKGVFTRSLESVRAQPHEVAEDAIKKLLLLGCCQQYHTQINRLREIIKATPVVCPVSDIVPLLNEFHLLLTQLNRNLDPENTSSTIQ